jgi:RNA polymerase sigma factor (sigma-70 family)
VTDCADTRRGLRQQVPAREETTPMRARSGVSEITAASSVDDAVLDRTDADAVSRSLNDPSAFASVFDRHFVAVHRYVHRRAGRDIADEVAGATFRVAFEGRKRWSQGTTDARPWLFGIATNLLRRHRRLEERRLRALGRAGADDWAVFDELAITERADARRTRAILAAALAALSPEERDVVSLVTLGDLTYDDAAQALGIPAGTVASRLNRARRTLAEMLAREEDSSG